MADKLFSFLILLFTCVGGYIWWNYFYILDGATEANSKVIFLESSTGSILVKDIVLLETVKEQANILTPLEQFQEKREAKKYIDSAPVGEYYYKIQENTRNADLYVSNDRKVLGKKILSFPEIQASNISVLPVYGDSDLLIISSGKQKYLWSEQNNKSDVFHLAFDIQYAKILGKDLFLVTPKGTFIYHTQSKEIEYYILFSDLLFTQRGILGIIKNTDIQRKYRFDVVGKQNDLLVLYNRENKRIKILKEYPEIKKLYQNTLGQYILETANELIEIQNVEG